MVEDKKLDKSLVMEEIATVHPSAAEEMLHLREQLKTEKEQKVNSNQTKPDSYKSVKSFSLRIDLQC